MTYLYDVSLYLNKDEAIEKICWKNHELQQKYEGFWKKYLGSKLDETGELKYHTSEETLSWHGDLFQCQQEILADGTMLLFLKRGIDREVIYESALDALDESIQIYDEHGDIVFFNRTCREIVGENRDVEGKNLLDVFDVEEEDSTTLEALRMKAPVKNRFRHYYSKEGKELFTVNSAFPMEYHGQIVGALTLEENISVIARKAEQLEKLQSAMKEKVVDASVKQHKRRYNFQDLVGHHPQMEALKELAKKVARQENNILIVGETGTGKEILAQSIYEASSRRNGAFIALNCAAIPESLIESILFGTTKGSFTGSIDKPGLLEEADTGTLFLDELNSMSMGMQSKVLRALQEKTFRRVGGNKEFRTDARIISSCNENPFMLMEQKKIRSDLFYRLATIILEIPPLRDRPEDIEELILHHINQIKNSYAFPFEKIGPEVVWQLQQYTWPGNVRELFHVIDYAMNVASDDVFRMEYLPAYCLRNKEPVAGEPSVSSEPDEMSGTLQAQVEVFEAKLIQKTLKHCCGNVSQAARQLGIQRQSLQYRLRKYGIIN